MFRRGAWFWLIPLLPGPVSRSSSTMGLGKRLDVPVQDLSLIRGLWEVRVKKQKQKQKKEQERVEKSALAR